MKLYLDVCCYNRPFDDFSADRINLEAEAVTIILERCEKEQYELVSSDIVNFEVSKIPNKDKQDAVLRMVKIGVENIKINNNIISLAQKYAESNIKPFDALHLASAEYGQVDVLLTTDDKLLKKAADLNISFKVMNPIDFIYEEL